MRPIAWVQHGFFMTFSPPPSHLADASCRPDGTPPRTQNATCRFAAILAGAALFCAPQAWAQGAVEAEDEDFKRHYASIAFSTSGGSCGDKADTWGNYFDQETSISGGGGGTRSRSLSVECSSGGQGQVLVYGYRLTKRWGAEVGYLDGENADLQASASRTINSSTRSGSYGSTLATTTLYGAGTFRFGGGIGYGWVLFGLGSYDTSASDSASSDDYTPPAGFESDDGISPVIGIGYTFDIGKGVGISLSYRNVTAAFAHTGVEVGFSF